MLLQSLDVSRHERVLSLIPLVQFHSERLPRKGLPSLRSEVSSYENDILFQIHKSRVIDYYFALSVTTLRSMNDEFHSGPNLKYDRCMSPHEAFIYKRLTGAHGLPVIRQLLIGGTHADLYIPALHYCIEPSSERYFSTSYRARMESLTDYERARMLGLGTWHTENYQRTVQDLDRIIPQLKSRQPPLSPKEIQDNLFSMACHTLPKFIPYKNFCLLVKTDNSPSEMPI